MENSFKIFRLGYLALIIPAMVLLLMAPLFIILCIVKSNSITIIHWSNIWFWVFIIIFSSTALVISYLITHKIVHIIFEGWKLEKLHAKDQEKEAKALKRYEEDQKQRIESEHYKLSVEFIKYVMDLDPKESTEARLPEKELMNQLNHFIAEHKKIISSSENPKAEEAAD